jgi:hypothetical protein
MTERTDRQKLTETIRELALLDHLEKRGRITTTFKTPFIERKRWKLNEPPAPKEKEHKQ